METTKLAKGVLVLKTGQRLDIVTNPAREYTADTLTKDTLNTFVGDAHQAYIVQGDNIAYIEVLDVN